MIFLTGKARGLARDTCSLNKLNEYSSFTAICFLTFLDKILV